MSRRPVVSTVSGAMFEAVSDAPPHTEVESLMERCVPPATHLDGQGLRAREKKRARIGRAHGRTRGGGRIGATRQQDRRSGGRIGRGRSRKRGGRAKGEERRRPDHGVFENQRVARGRHPAGMDHPGRASGRRPGGREREAARERDRERRSEEPNADHGRAVRSGTST